YSSPSAWADSATRTSQPPGSAMERAPHSEPPAPTGLHPQTTKTQSNRTASCTFLLLSLNNSVLPMIRLPTNVNFLLWTQVFRVAVLKTATAPHSPDHFVRHARGRVAFPQPSDCRPVRPIPFSTPLPSKPGTPPDRPVTPE